MTQDDFAAMRAGAADFKKQVCDLEFAGLRMMGVPVATARHAVNYFEHLAAKVEQTGCAQRADECSAKAAAPSVPSGEVDTPEFQALLDEFAYRASERRALGGDFGSAESEGVAESALIDHVARQVQAAHDALRTIADFPITDRLRNMDAVNMRDIAIRAFKSAAPQAPQPKQAAWVSVDERLPKVETDVLVFGKRGDSICYTVAGLFSGEWLAQESERELRFCVSHWTDLPAAPQAAATDKPAQQEKQQ